MKHSIKRILFILFLLPALGISASPEARFHLIKMEYKLNPDGSQEQRIRKELSVYTHPAMNDTYGETFVVYNPDYQTLTINESYTKQSDGTIIQNPENAFVKQLPSAAAKAPYYNRITEMAIVHTGLDLGSTIYLDYTLTTKPGYLPALDLYLPIAEASPIDRYEIHISVPTDKELSFRTFGSFPTCSQKESATTHEYFWTLRNLPETPTEPHAPLPYLLVASTYPNSATAADYYGKQGIVCPTDNPLFREILASADTCTDTTAKIHAIASYTNTHVANCPLPFAQASYRIRPCADVLQSAYGTAAEKAMLLHTLLKSAGISSAIAMKGTWPSTSQEAFPTLAAPMHFTLSINDGKQIIRIDPLTGKEIPANNDPTGTFSLIYPQTPLQTPAGNALYASKNKETYQKEITLVMDPNGKITSSTSEAIQADSINEHYRLLQLPVPQEQPSTALHFSNSKRINPILLPRPIEESIQYEIQLPAGVKMLSKERHIHLNNKVGKLHISLEKTATGAKVVRTLSIPEVSIPTARYSDLYQLLRIWQDPALLKILISQ